MPLRSFTAAEMLLTQRRHLERPLLVTIWLGVSSFSLAEGNLVFFLAGTLAVGVNLLAVRRASELYVRRLFVNIAVVLATVLLLCEMLSRGTELRVAMGHYLILIQLCKLFERKANRDYVQMLLLSILLMVASALLWEQLWFAMLLVVYIASACYTAMLFTLKRGLDAVAAARLPTEPEPPSPDRLAWNITRHWPGPAIRRRLWVILLAVLATGVGMFLVAPRGWGGTKRFARGQGGAAVSGFGGAVRLGDAKVVSLSDRVVMHVRIKRDGAYGPATERTAYLRGRTFSHYADSRWSAFTAESTSVRPKPMPTSPPRAMPAGTVAQEVSMSSELLPHLFAVHPVVGLDLPTGSAQITEDLSLRANLPAGLTRLIRYTAYSLPRPLAARRARRRRRASMPGQTARTVAVMPEVAALGRTWCKDLLAERDSLSPERRGELNLALAVRIVEGLQRRCSYSLDLSAAQGDRDGVEDFLFHMKRGHCEYFASALTVMCRALGVRARLATGFLLTEYDDLAEQHVVRDRHAHAWTEVYSPGTGWVVVDPSPSARLQAVGRHGRLASLKDFWENLKFAWYKEVIGYDATARSKLGRWVRNAVATPAEAIRDGFVNLLAHGYVDEALIRFMWVVGLVWLVLVIMIAVRLIRRRIARRRDGSFAAASRKLGFLLKLFSLLERRGLRPRPCQTMHEAAAEAARRFNLPPDVLGGLIDVYYRMRWGHAPPSAEELHAAERQVERLGAMLGKG